MGVVRTCDEHGNKKSRMVKYYQNMRQIFSRVIYGFLMRERRMGKKTGVEIDCISSTVLKIHVA